MAVCSSSNPVWRCRSVLPMCIDTKTLKRIEELSRLPDYAKKQVFLVVDALNRDFKAKDTVLQKAPGA